jgi:hypothetical protein
MELSIHCRYADAWILWKRALLPVTTDTMPHLFQAAQHITRSVADPKLIGINNSVNEQMIHVS